MPVSSRLPAGEVLNTTMARGSGEPGRTSSGCIRGQRSSSCRNAAMRSSASNCSFSGSSPQNIARREVRAST
jgi:hypothetical protein